MSEPRDLLIEIGTEELPPKALLRLSQAFTDGVRKGLEQAGLAFGNVHSYAAPRRWRSGSNNSPPRRPIANKFVVARR